MQVQAQAEAVQVQAEAAQALAEAVQAQAEAALAQAEGALAQAEAVQAQAAPHLRLKTRSTVGSREVITPRASSASSGAPPLTLPTVSPEGLRRHPVRKQT